MKNNIPIAEDFINQYPMGSRILDAQQFMFCRDLMIEFTKLHLKAQVKAICTKATRHNNNVILNAYPESNIK